MFSDDYNFVKAAILTYLEAHPYFTPQRITLFQYLDALYKQYRNRRYIPQWALEGRILKELKANHFILGVDPHVIEDYNGYLSYRCNTNKIERACMAGLWNNFLRVGVMP